MTSGEAWARMQRALDANHADPSPRNIAAVNLARLDLSRALQNEGTHGAKRFRRDTAAAKRAAFNFLKP